MPPTIWDRGRDRVVGWVKDQALTRAKRTLEDQLARIIETANAHEAKGLPHGSPAYVALQEHANRKIGDFCAKHGVERLAIEQEVPVLRDLEALTQTPSLITRVGQGPRHPPRRHHRRHGDRVCRRPGGHRLPLDRAPTESMNGGAA